MFRPPVRLEKWIAYDGALGADLLVQEAEADDNADDGDDGFDLEHDGGDAGSEYASSTNDNDDDNDDDNAAGSELLLSASVTSADGKITLTLDQDDNENGFWASDTNGISHEATITITMTDDALAKLFPYLNDSGFFSGDLAGSSDHIQAGDLYFEISAPDGGSFGFYLWSDVQNNPGQFITDNNIANGKYMMFVVDGGDGTFYLQEFQCNRNNNTFVITGAGGTNQDGSTGQIPGGKVEFETTADGGIRFHLIDKGRTTAGNALLESVFRSITFTPNDPSAPPSTVTGFDIALYHQDGIRNQPYDPSLFSDDPGGMYDPLNDNVVADSTDSNFEHITHPDSPGPGPGPNPDPGGDDDIIPPVIPPSPGDGDGDGDDSGDGDDAEDGESDQSGGDPVYIFRREDDIGANDDYETEDEAREDAAPAAEANATEDKGSDNAAAAELLALTRDMEFLLTAVQNEREVLLGLISRLQSEYLAREPVEYGELRDYLRRLFDMGRREEETVSRIIDAMNREMRVFRNLTPGQRDGMLTESVRELIDSAERRSGEMGAFSRAVEAVADLLAARRDNGLPPPTQEETSAVFAAQYEQALAQWQIRAERLDPMGREFTAAQRVAASAK